MADGSALAVDRERRAEVGLWLRWLLACTAGGVLSGVLLDLLGRLVATGTLHIALFALLAPVFGAALFALPQGVVLGRLLPLTLRWPLRTAIGGLLAAGSLLLYIQPLAGGLAILGVPNAAATALLAGATGGVLGAWQAPLLWRLSIRARGWAGASAGGWAMALLAAGAGGMLGLPTAISGLGVGVAYWIITGAVLARARVPAYLGPEPRARLRRRRLQRRVVVMVCGGTLGAFGLLSALGVVSWVPSSR